MLNKKTVFIITAVCMLALTSAVYATFVEPTFTPSGGNTPIPLKTGPDEFFKMKYPFGVGAAHSKDTKILDYVKNNQTNKLDELILQTKNNVTTVNGYTHFSGIADIFVNPMATIVDGDLRVKNPDETNNGKGTTPPFNQYFLDTKNKFVDLISNVDKPSFYKQSKPVEAYLPLRLLSRVVIADKENFIKPEKYGDSSIQNRNLEPAYDLELQYREGTGGFAPTTNIGLGEFCEVSASEMNSYGCPNGAYISTLDDTGNIFINDPTLNGTNREYNKNTKTYTMKDYTYSSTPYAMCTYWAPSKNPANIGNCYIRYGNYGAHNNYVFVSVATSGSGNSCTTSLSYNTNPYININSTSIGTPAITMWYKNGVPVFIDPTNQKTINKCWTSGVDAVYIRTTDGRNFAGIKS